MALTKKLTAIADAIRDQSGGAEKLTLDQMPIEIANFLNFKVVGNPQPTSPSENTIWLNTDVPITGYDFSANEPTNPVDGMVWVAVRSSSTVAFSATKKNPVMVYPISAKQYVGGAWTNKKAEIYQIGAWKPVFSEIYIVRNGALNDVPIAVDRTGNTVTQGNGYAVFSASKNTIGVFTTEDTYDLTQYKKLRITITAGLSYAVSGKSPGLVIGTSRPTSTANSSASITNVIAFKAFPVTGGESVCAVTAGTYELDVTDYTGEHYVGLIIGGSNYIGNPYVNVTEFALV